MTAHDRAYSDRAIVVSFDVHREIFLLCVLRCEARLARAGPVGKRYFVYDCAKCGITPHSVRDKDARSRACIALPSGPYCYSIT